VSCASRVICDTCAHTRRRHMSCASRHSPPSKLASAYCWQAACALLRSSSVSARNCAECYKNAGGDGEREATKMELLKGRGAHLAVLESARVADDAHHVVVPVATVRECRHTRTHSHPLPPRTRMLEKMWGAGGSRRRAALQSAAAHCCPPPSRSCAHKSCANVN